jgi:uncharacterized protein
VSHRLFRSRADFRPQTNYRLLPFRFGRLDDQRCLLTNEVGEYVVLRRDELQAFVDRCLDLDSGTYRSLKARHFLFDDTSRVALDLLALKYRTRAEPLSCFTGLHIFVVTLRCTNSCRYCQVSRRSEDDRTFDMSVAHADLALDFTFRTPSPTIKIEFQGGEPLLNFPIVRHVVERATQLSDTFGKHVEFVLASNLALLSDDVVDFCKKHHVSFSTSLDGPRDLHDAHRLLRGRASHHATVTSIERIQRDLGADAVSALMTTTRNSFSRARDIVAEYVRRNLHGIFLRNTRPYGLAVQSGLAGDCSAPEWVAFYQEALEEILAVNRAGYFLREEYTTILLQKVFAPGGTRFVDLQSPSGIGIAAVAFNYDGAVYASDEGRMLAEMGDESFRLGHLERDSFDAMMTSDRLLDILADTMLEGVPQCSDCAFLPYCGADPVFHHATQGDPVGHKAWSDFCAKQMGVLRHLVALLEDNAEARETLLTWI